jgi:hypothetical protein
VLVAANPKAAFYGVDFLPAHIRAGETLGVRMGLDWLKRLKKAQVKYFRDNPALAEAVDELDRVDPRYMAHEYFNEHLRAFYFTELKGMMETRGLYFAGCSRLFLNMVDFGGAQGVAGRVPPGRQPRRAGSQARLHPQRNLPPRHLGQGRALAVRG